MKKHHEVSANSTETEPLNPKEKRERGNGVNGNGNGNVQKSPNTTMKNSTSANALNNLGTNPKPKLSELYVQWPHWTMGWVIGVFTSFWVLLVFLFASICINILQLCAMCSIFIPRHNRLYISQWLANQLWALFPFITEVWSNTPFIFTGDAFENPAPHSANCVLLGNHAPGMDFVTGITLSSLPFGPGCGRMMTMMKKSLECYPVIGWTHSLQGSLFLKRNFSKDEKFLAMRLHEMESNVYPYPYWMGVYPEGTRITPQKRIESQAFAKERNLPILQNLLLPRTKGFLYLLKHVRTSLTHIYDATCAYLGSPLLPHHPFIYGRFLCTGVHVHMTVTNVKDITQAKEESAQENDREQWLLAQWKRKDELLEHFSKSFTFPGKHYVTPASRRRDLRNLFFIWSAIVIFIASRLCSPKTVMLAVFALTLTHLKIVVEKVTKIH